MWEEVASFERRLLAMVQMVIRFSSYISNIPDFLRNETHFCTAASVPLDQTLQEAFKANCGDGRRFDSHDPAVANRSISNALWTGDKSEYAT